MTEPAYLPCSEVMEKAALSSAMHHPELLLRHPHDPSVYHLVGHRVIYETMRSLAQEGRPVDMPTLWYAMGEPEWPSYSYLSVLDGEYPDWTAYDYYVGQLIGYHLRRQVVMLGEAAAQRAQVSGIDSNPAELLSWLRERVSGLSGETLGFRHAMACEPGTDSAPVTTGFEILDAQLLGGPRAGELVVVMGRPGMGKTSLMLSSCLRQAARGLKVGIFSLEMSHRELMLRLLSIESGVGFQALRLAADDSFLPGPERQSLLEARERLAEYRIEIDDQAALGLADLENRAYQLKSAKGLDVLWVDNMPLVATKEESDYRAMSKVSWAMKALAKNLKIPVFALHQLSRLVERRESHRPILSDLADSGKIEANADTVIGLYRPWVYDNRESQEAAELHVLKQRNGPIGTLGMMFLPSSMEYREER